MSKKFSTLILSLILLPLLTACNSVGKVIYASGQQLPDYGRVRTIITTDGEMDDQNSFIRYLLYANEFDTRGIVLTSSVSHYAGDESNENEAYRQPYRWGGTDWMETYIHAYGEVWANLRQHDAAYPSPDTLQSLVRVGNVAYPGDMSQDTEGSELIKNEILKEEDGKLYIQCWGGANTVARALKSIEEEGVSPELREQIAERTVLYLIGEQDDTYQEYISVNWSELPVMINTYQYDTLAFGWKNHDEMATRTFYGKWMEENILADNPLLSLYHTYLDGHIYEGENEGWQFGLAENMESPENIWYTYYDLTFEKHDFISEGDSPAFLFLLNPGLRSLEQYSNGGWGGRFSVPRRGSLYKDKKNWTLDYWIEDIQQDFANRIAWCTLDYSSANHAPSVSIPEGYDISAVPGAVVSLTCTATDPDGDALSIIWCYDTDCSSSKSTELPTLEATGDTVKIKIPKDCVAGNQLHILCTVSDDSSIPMKAYARIIITIL